MPYAAAASSNSRGVGSPGSARSPAEPERRHAARPAGSRVPRGPGEGARDGRQFPPGVPVRSGEGFLEQRDGLCIPLLLEARQSLAPDLSMRLPEVPLDTRVPQEQIGQRDRLVVVRHEHRHAAQHVDDVPGHGRPGVDLVVHPLELGPGDVEDEGRGHGPQPGTIAVVDPDLPEDEHLREKEAHRREIGGTSPGSPRSPGPPCSGRSALLCRGPAPLGGTGAGRRRSSPPSLTSTSRRFGPLPPS